MSFSTRYQYFAILMAVFIATTGYGVSFPLLAISLERMGTSSGLIGLNAAMPALGWLLASAALPRLHMRYSLPQLMIGFLVVSVLGLGGLWLFQNYSSWLFSRLLFGGGIGMFFRTVEFWINAQSEKTNRGRLFGGYSVSFILGILIGSIVQPELGSSGPIPFAVVLACLALTVSLVIPLGLSLPDRQSRSSLRAPELKQVFRIAPVALAGVLMYGFFEDVPAYLLSVYALKVGFTEEIAAYTLSSVALGILVFSVPLGWLSDRIGRTAVLNGSALVGLSGAVIIPLLQGNAIAFLGFLVLWGGAIGSIYNVSQAIIGDRFENGDLISANASFGICYAAAALIGPVANGLAMQLWEPNGLMVSSALTFGLFMLFVTPLRRKVEDVR